MEKESHQYDEHPPSTDHGSLPKRGYSYDLPHDDSMNVTDEQLRSLGAIQQHLWKALRFKIQRFFVPNVTTPQVGYCCCQCLYLVTPLHHISIM